MFLFEIIRKLRPEASSALKPPMRPISPTDSIETPLPRKKVFPILRTDQISVPNPSPLTESEKDKMVRELFDQLFQKIPFRPPLLSAILDSLDTNSLVTYEGEQAKNLVDKIAQRLNLKRF